VPSIIPRAKMSIAVLPFRALARSVFLDDRNARNVPPWLCLMDLPLAVEARDVGKHFGSVTALDGLTLEVNAGEIYGLLGPNGSGKTTFIRALAGLVRPDAGELRVFGAAPRAAVAAGAIGYMTQAPALYTDLSVDENLRFFAALQGVADAAARIEEALRRVDLLDRRRSTVNTLSGGMRTRISLAATLLHQPRLLLLDEPTVGVDPALRREFWEHFRALASSGVTLLVSSHVMDEAARCDRLGLIRAGRVLAQGTSRELIARAGSNDLEGAFLTLSAAPA
jgi:ABC-2 type transport system ATP-binding protein